VLRRFGACALAALDDRGTERVVGLPPRRRFKAAVSGSLFRRTERLVGELALLTAKRLPPEIIIRKKRGGMFESILEEAETGLDPAVAWQDELRTLDDAKREHVLALVARLGHNRSEAARRLGVDRSTVARILDPK
jgi:transcriptional regulator of acetoin/glycerol metabolism